MGADKDKLVGFLQGMVFPAAFERFHGFRGGKNSCQSLAKISRQEVIAPAIVVFLFKDIPPECSGGVAMATALLLQLARRQGGKEGLALAGYAQFFRLRMALQGVSQVLAVIQGNAGDGANVGVEQIDRVQSPTHARLPV